MNDTASIGIIGGSGLYQMEGLTVLDERKIVLVLKPSVRDWLAEKGWDPAYGARPLKRVIQKSIQDPLAALILSGRIQDGETVVISVGKQGLTFNDELAAAA